jgi:3'(2'), 5'-bisphosphate nucleotidase
VGDTERGIKVIKPIKTDMPLNCSSLASRVPLILGGLKTTATTRVGGGGVLFNFFNKTHQNNSLCIASLPLNKRNDSKRFCLSSSSSSSSSSVMEGIKDSGFSTREIEKYSKELDIAVRAVQMACSLCQKVQESLISKTNSQVQAKDDNSPVTVAGMH